LYGFVQNNPVSYFDPYGLKKNCITRIYLGHFSGEADIFGEKNTKERFEDETKNPPRSDASGFVTCWGNKYNKDKKLQNAIPNGPDISRSISDDPERALREFPEQTRSELPQNAKIILIKMLKAAKKHAPRMCKKPKSCKTIEIIIEPLKGNEYGDPRRFLKKQFGWHGTDSSIYDCCKENWTKDDLKKFK